MRANAGAHVLSAAVLEQILASSEKRNQEQNLPAWLRPSTADDSRRGKLLGGRGSPASAEHVV
eukprot:2478758-Prymnesium_polylepis.1